MSPADVDARMGRPEAIAIARAFVERIEDCCERLVVAGSLRRRLARIGDIEIVVVPKVERRADGLFADMPTDVDRLDARLTAMLDGDEVEKRPDRNGVPRWGPSLKYLTYRGARVDLFMPDAARFGWILMLRTGPAAFSRQLVVGKDRRTRDGRPGLLTEHIHPADGWLTRGIARERIETPNESDVFELLGLRYLEPWERT